MVERGDLPSQLRMTLGKIEVALSAVNDAIVWTDHAGVIQWCNRSFDRLVGKRHIEVLGARLAGLLPLEREGRALPAEAHPVSVVFNAQPNLADRYELQRADRRWILDISGTRTQFGEHDTAAVFVIYDITERTRAEETLKQQTAQLEAANKELEAFSYSVSHDLRAPLRVISAFSGILLQDHAGQLDAEGTRILRVIRANVKQMGQLIHDLLTFSRLGRQAMVVSDIDMDAMVRAVWEELRPLPAERTLRLVLNPLPPVLGDKALMHQVWINLLSNAIKFTRPKEPGVVEIGAQAANSEEVSYYVKDNGVGFDMQYVDTLFGVFQRLHDPEEFEGTGVGLALVQRVIHRHGGRVWAEGAVNEGATFSFTLPKGGNRT